MRKIPLTILLILMSITMHGQITIKGTIVNKNTLEPVPYANIGIVNQNVGTISNKDGSFAILIPKRLNKDTLAFSSLGFGEKRIAIHFFQPDELRTIYLHEMVKLLPAVIVSSKKEKANYFELGNKAVRSGNLETDTTYAGRAIALLIENKEPYLQTGLNFPAYLEKAQLRIFRNNLKSFKFRVRLNDVDSLTGGPGKDLLQESIVMESSMKKGWLTFDLSELNYEVSKPFYITKRKLIMVLAGILVKTKTVIASGFMQEIPLAVAPI